VPANSLAVLIEGESLAGPFALVVPVGEMTVERLNQGILGPSPTGGDAVTQTVTIVTQTGAPGQPGPPGAAGPGGSVDATELRPDFDGFYACDSMDEVVVDQSYEDCRTITGESMTLTLLARARADDGTTGTIRVRVGGTDGQPDGTVAATATVNGDPGSTYTTLNASDSLAKPEAIVPVKLTIQSSDGGDVLLKETQVKVR